MIKAYNKKSIAAWIISLAVVLCVGFYIGRSLLKAKTSVEVSELEIKMPANKASVKIGASQHAVINALGTPAQIASYSSQADYKEGTVLKYNGAKFYFVHDKLANFEITSHIYNVSLGITHKNIAIGNTSSQLPRIKILNQVAVLNVTSDDTPTDKYLEYDMSDSGKVTRISYSDY